MVAFCRCDRLLPYIDFFRSRNVRFPLPLLVLELLTFHRSAYRSSYSTIIPRLRALHAADSNHTAPHSRPRARILGVHFEGAHAEHHLTSPGASGLASLMDRYALTDADIASGFLCIVSLAPELEGALESISAMSARGAIASIGHTAATYDQANAVN
jgi:N-acetylglucosamine-6-phosphate deacetylase